MNTLRFDQILSAATGPDKIPGLVATFATDDGVRYEGAFGVRELGQPQPMTMATLLNIASMTKAVTGVAAMRCVERGLLSLDAPAGEVIPFLGRVQVLDGFDADGQPRLRPPTSPVTLRNLLTHTSGFVYEIWNGDLQRYLEVTGTPGLGSGTNASLETPLLFDPGGRWEYGIGIDWAGKLVEAVTGKRLGAYMADEIFGPLGMSSTSFERNADQSARRATMHMRTPNGLVAAPAPANPGAREYDGGGGGLHSTAQDYLRFARMLLHGGELEGTRLLKPATVALMSESHIGALDVEPLRTVMPTLSNDCDFYPGMPQKWGLTFLINTTATPEGRSAGSLAWAGLLNTYYWIDPVKRVTGVIGAQILPFFDAEVMAVFCDFERAVYDEL